MNVVKDFDNEYNLVDEYKRRYLAAAHAMQWGVAMNMNYETGETTPKHLRVGINSSMVQTSALVSLLIKKGIITEEEWWLELAEFMEAEAASYQKMIQRHVGIDHTQITLA